MPHEYVFERRISLGRPKYLQGGGLGGEGNEREEREAGKGTSVGGLCFTMDSSCLLYTSDAADE